jgi:hypothetical protein
LTIANQLRLKAEVQAGTKPLLLPCVFTAALLALGFTSPARQNPRVLWACIGAAAILLLCTATLFFWAKRNARSLQIEVVLKKQHYLQACAQGSVLLYWGWYWPQVYAFAPFILAQLLFAYAFDMLLAWCRRDTYSLGFAQVPVVFSINLFLWFRPDWFYLQLLMLGLGLAAKELIRWTKDGRRVHIFNPSSFPLAVFSLILLATGKSGITWGQEIATTQFYPPHMYLMLFLIGLPGQYFFGVTSMTMSAVMSAWAFGRLYFAFTGIYFFYDSYIPIAVFLGMHLLFTDPSTSPRSELGRIIYGTIYGLSTAGLYQLLGSEGMPTFYDKLLQVPLMNLAVKGIDRMSRSHLLQRLNPAKVASSLAPRRRNLAYMSVWAGIFAVLSATQALGDEHPGQWLPFWRNACQQGRAYACPYLADVEINFCNRRSGWACNEAGLLHIALARSGEDLRRQNAAGAAVPLLRGCELGFRAACDNLRTLNSGGGTFAAANPGLQDYPIILRGSKGEIRERDPAALRALACRQGWADACATQSANSR